MSATRQNIDGVEGVLVGTTTDPTRTTTVERRYAQRLRGGYQAINALVREYVARRDYLGLADETAASLTAARRPPNVVFARDDRKIERYREWLAQVQREEVLSAVGPNQNRYIAQAYATGVRTTNTQLRQAGVADPPSNVTPALQIPVHENTIQRLFTRNFSELQGLTDEMGREVARELSQALGEGVGPRGAARRITDVLGSVTDGTPHGAQARATTIARTEILRARHLAAQSQYQRFGVELVEPILAPTACPECVAIAADAPYRTAEISSIWPPHPNCRCSVTIYTGSREATASARRVPARAVGNHHGHTH